MFVKIFHLNTSFFRLVEDALIIVLFTCYFLSCNIDPMCVKVSNLLLFLLFDLFGLLYSPWESLDFLLLYFESASSPLLVSFFFLEEISYFSLDESLGLIMEWLIFSEICFWEIKLNGYFSNCFLISLLAYVSYPFL